jgi:hypothetical protein
MDTRHLFVLCLAGFYVFMVYLSLIERDFMQQRFLFAPACLLYPWGAKELKTCLAGFGHIPVRGCGFLYFVYFSLQPLLQGLFISLTRLMTPCLRPADLLLKQNFLMAP